MTHERQKGKQFELKETKEEWKLNAMCDSWFNVPKSKKNFFNHNGYHWDNQGNSYMDCTVDTIIFILNFMGIII